MRQDKKKQRSQTDDRRDFHSLDRRSSSQNRDSASIFSTSKTERPVKSSQKTKINKKADAKKNAARKKAVKKQSQTLKNRKISRQDDLLYDTRNFDIVDVESASQTGGSTAKKRKASSHIRAITVIIVSLVIFFIVALVGIFLIFKLKTIDVIGESKYSKEEIIAATGYAVGDNLFFLPISEVETLLPSKLPYIEIAKITREIPNKITIDISASRQAAVFNYNNESVLVDGDGKIIDILQENNPKGIQVTGVEIQEPQISNLVAITDTAQNDAFYLIINKLKSMDALSHMTALDLSNVEEIVLTYQDRVKMELGSVTRLAYKIQFGHSIVQDANKILETEHGRLDLTLRTDVNKARFLPEYNFSSDKNSAQNISENGSDSEPVDLEPFAVNPGRGNDVPNEPYTGTKEDSNSGNSTDNNDGGVQNDDTTE